MTSVIKSICPKLFFFFKTVVIYFVVLIPDEKPSLSAVILKCLPILSLVLFVYLHKVSLGPKYKFSKRILFGLMSCCVGDALLIWPELFEFGMVAFAIGHFFYISAFGLKPPKLPIGVFLFALAGIGANLMVQNVNNVLLMGIPIYSLILSVTVWRAIARVAFTKKQFTWASLCGAIGAISFACSDFVIGLNNFVYKVPFQQVIIMVTYYIAQLGISLSVDDERSLNSVK